jgi:hypothetical protein
MGGGKFIDGNDELKFIFDKDGKPVSAETIENGEVTRFFPERQWTPTSEDLASFKGDWFSEEAGATFTVAVEADKVFIKQRPVTSLPMQPLYKDHFGAQGFLVWFTRDKDGNVTGPTRRRLTNARHAVRPREVAGSGWTIEHTRRRLPTRSAQTPKLAKRATA